tara:strand:+ start:644 stop:919 length:276 start_codon:yes stop_codon:yes gene_type:complete
MNEIEAEECYKAIGVLLAHVDSLEGKGLNEHRLKVVESEVKKYLPCKCEEFSILDNIHHGDEYEMEIRIQCDNCGKLGVRVYNYADITNWD